MKKDAVDADFKCAMEDFIQDYLNKYGWLIDLSKKYFISPSLFENILKFVERVPKMRKEKSPLSLGLAFKNKVLNLEEPLMSYNPFHISEMRNFSNLKNAVAGNPLCYILDPIGLVSIGQVPKSMILTSPDQTLRNYLKSLIH